MVEPEGGRQKAEGGRHRFSCFGLLASVFGLPLTDSPIKVPLPGGVSFASRSFSIGLE
jgi:hypothetical protein